MPLTPRRRRIARRGTWGTSFGCGLGYSAKAADLSAKRGIVEIGQGKAAG